MLLESLSRTAATQYSPLHWPLDFEVAWVHLEIHLLVCQFREQMVFMLSRVNCSTSAANIISCGVMCVWVCVSVYMCGVGDECWWLCLLFVCNLLDVCSCLSVKTQSSKIYSVGRYSKLFIIDPHISTLGFTTIPVLNNLLMLINIYI